MAERFGDAALRHLATAELLNDEGHADDAAYHYGLVGEMSLKEAFIRATGISLPTSLQRHLNQGTKPLQKIIAQNSQLISLLSGGRLGGALGNDLMHGLLTYRFSGWSIDIRYADDDHCPVKKSDIDIWKSDASDLYNNGVF